MGFLFVCLFLKMHMDFRAFDRVTSCTEAYAQLALVDAPLLHSSISQYEETEQ